MNKIGFLFALPLCGASISCSSLSTPLPDCWIATQLPADRDLAGRVIIYSLGKHQITMHPLKCEGKGGFLNLPEGTDLQRLAGNRAIRSFMGGHFYEALVSVRVDKSTVGHGASFSLNRISSIKEIDHPIWVNKEVYDKALENSAEDDGSRFTE